MTLTPAQFEALAKLAGRRKSANPSTHVAVRLHFVGGLTIAEAARGAGADYRVALKAIHRARDVLVLARMVAGNYLCMRTG